VTLWRFTIGAAPLGAALLAAGLAAAATPDALPQSPDELAAMVQEAIAERDLATLERIVKWDGAGVMKKRIVRYELRHQFGRPIAQASLEPFPADGLDGLKERGTLAANMPVSHRLKLVYDEPPVGNGKAPPTSVFLVGPDGDTYKIALVVRQPGPRRD
jgi:hypothetical protein